MSVLAVFSLVVRDRESGPMSIGLTGDRESGPMSLA